MHDHALQTSPLMLMSVWQNVWKWVNKSSIIHITHITRFRMNEIRDVMSNKWNQGHGVVLLQLNNDVLPHFQWIKSGTLCRNCECTLIRTLTRFWNKWWSHYHNRECTLTVTFSPTFPMNEIRDVMSYYYNCECTLMRFKMRKWISTHSSINDGCTNTD